MIAVKGIYSNGKVLLNMPSIISSLPQYAEVMVIFDTNLLSESWPTESPDDPIIGIFSGSPNLATDAENILTHEFLPQHA